MMSRRKTERRWQVTSLPAWRRALLRALPAEQARLDQIVARARAIGRVDHAVSLASTATVWGRLASVVEDAALIWVTGPMSRVMMDAALDCPAVTGDDMPAAAGLVGFAEPLPPKDTSGIGGLALRRSETELAWQWDEPVPVDAIIWDASAGDNWLRVWLCCLTSRLPYPLLGTATPLSPFMSVRMLLPTPLGSSLADAGDDGVTRDMAGPGAVLQSMWTLSATPSIAAPRRVDGRYGGPAQPRTRPASGDGGGTGRRLRHRFVVRGHWTHQPYGPGRSLRKLIWRQPYLKGPADAPLLDTAKVSVWRS